MLPAAVVSAVVKVDGMQAAVSDLTRFSTVTKDAGLSATKFQASAGAISNVTGKVSSAVNTMGRNFNKAGNDVKSLSRETEKTHHSLSGMANNLLAVGGAFAAYDLAKNAIRNTVDLGEQTSRLSAATGMSIKTSSEWITTMSALGQSSTATTRSFVTLSRNVRNAEDGSKTAQKAFKELGITQDQLKNSTPTQLMEDVANGFANIVEPSHRAALAQQLFGIGTQALLPVLAGGKKGIDEMLGSANKFGAYLPNNKKQIEQAVAAQTQWNLAMTGLQITFTKAVLPSLVKGADSVMLFIQQMREGRGEGGKFGRELTHAFVIVKNAVNTVTGVVGGIKPALEIAAGAFVGSKLLHFSATFARDIGSAVKGLTSIPGKLRGLVPGGKTASKLESLTGGTAPRMSVMEMTVDVMIVKSTNQNNLPSNINKDIKKTGEQDVINSLEKDAEKAGVGAGGGGAVVKLLQKLKVLPSAAAEEGGVTAAEAFGASSPGAIPGLVAFGAGAAIPFATAYGIRQFQNLVGKGTGYQNLLTNPSSFGRQQFGARGPAMVGLNQYGVPIYKGQSATAGAPKMDTQTKDYLAFVNVLAKLEQKQAGIKKTGNALATLAKQALKIGDTRYGMADALGAELLKTRNVASRGVRGIVGALGNLPPRARAMAALAMIQMSQQLEKSGAVPKGTTTRLMRQIAGPLASIGIHAKNSASEVHQLKDAINSLPKSTDLTISVQLRSNMDPGIAAALASQYPTGQAPAILGGHIPRPKSMASHAAAHHAARVQSQIPNVNIPSAASLTAAAGGGVTGARNALAQVDATRTRLEVQRLGLEGTRNKLEVQLADARTKGGKAAIEHELKINAARIRGLSSELSVNALRKHELELQVHSNTTAASARAKALADQKKAAAAAAAAEQRRLNMLLSYLSHIPSQAPGQQVQMQLIQNRLTSATNAGNVGGQQRALGAERKLDKQWLALDKKKLKVLYSNLKKRGLSRGSRNQIMQDIFALLQEIGSIESDLGTVATSLSDLTGGSTTDTSAFDLAPTGSAVTMPTAFDVRSQIPKGGVIHHHHHHGNVIVNVNKGGDEKKVYDALDRVTGGPIHARVRRAGLRGT